MSPASHLRFSCIFILLFAPLLLATVALAQTAAVRIMPLGDSITGSPGCWRALLWDHLQRTGITHIDFVGTQPPQGCSIPYDGDSEGHGGALATAVADQNQLPVWLAATHPDIVMMHFGTNDIWSGRTPAVILTAFSKLVDQMRASNPNMIVLVAQIIPVNPSTCADCAQRTIEFNATIPSWAASKSTADSPIIVVDQWTGFVSATDTVEGVHPNAAGDQKIADKWFPVLSALLLGQAPAPGFSISASPPVPSISAGTSGISTINVTRTGGFTGPVTVIPPPRAGWTVSFSSNPIVGNSSTMTITVPGTAVPGLYPFPLSAVGGLLSSSTTVNVSVPEPLIPFFTLFASRGIQTIDRGSSTTNTITINRINNFAGPVALSTGPLPTGVTAIFSPNPATGATSTLTFTASPTAAAGASQVLVVGTGSPGTLNTTINLTISDPTTSPCGTPTLIPLPFARDGAGDFCFVTSGDITIVNSFNMQLVEINGVPFTNLWSNRLPPRINGNYFIHYVSNLPFSHFEATGTSAASNFLLASPTSFSFLPTGSTGSAVAITSNTSWTVSADQPWLTVSPVSGANNGMVTVNAPANATPTSRTGTVTVSGEGLVRTVSVTQATSVVTPPLPCADPLAITLPFVRNGEGDFCWVTSGNISFINSWNMQLLEINGVPFTNRWASSFPPRINGNYYIHYIANVAFAHFEANGSP